MSEGIPCDNIDCDSIPYPETETQEVSVEPSASAELITEDLRRWGVEKYIAGYANIPGRPPS